MTVGEQSRLNQTSVSQLSVLRNRKASISVIIDEWEGASKASANANALGLIKQFVFHAKRKIINYIICYNSDVFKPIIGWV